MSKSIYKQLVEVSNVGSIQDIILNPELSREPIESDDFITADVGVKGQDFVQRSVDLHEKSVKTLKENLIFERIDFLHIAQGIITLHKLGKAPSGISLVSVLTLGFFFPAVLVLLFPQEVFGFLLLV